MAASRMIPRAKPFGIGSFAPHAADPNYSHQLGSPENTFEFDESEVWTSSSNQATPSSTSRKLDLPKKLLLQPRKADNAVGATASSFPVNIPDWSKILKDGYDDPDRHHHRGRELGAGEDDDQDDDWACEGSVRIPPHEYLARRRGASFSVHEGVGRTLKGRDLRRVRNAVWKKVGFED